MSRAVSPTRSFLSRTPLRGAAAVRVLAFAAACAFGYTAARILQASSPSVSPELDNFDQALPFLGLALLATLFVAWQPSRPARPPREWPRAVLGFARDHRVEIGLFLLIFAFGVFMRLYRFGGTLPPSDGLCCEENINGGVAFRAIEGERPLFFLLGRWGSAAGLLLFGYDSFGLRVFFPLMAIVTLIPLYLLLRQLTSVPAALFGLALYASAWWPSLRARQATEGPIEAVLFSLFLVLAIRRRSAIAALFAGALAGLLSYEYEAFKVIPIAGVGFAGAAAAWQVFARRPLDVAGARSRALELWRDAWRPALVFLMAAGIVVLPIFIGERDGHDIYLTSVHRNEGTTGDRLKDNWRRQAKWVTQVYLPAGANEYPTTPPRDLPGRDLLDPIAGWLGLFGLAAGVLLFSRGFRAYFAGWILVSGAAASILLANFAAWKVLSMLPAFIVLATLLVDDVRTFVAKRFAVRGPLVFSLALAGAATFAFWFNADTLFNDVANEESVQRNYATESTVIFLPCREQRERGDDTYGVTFMNYGRLAGFAAPHETTAEQLGAWGDSLWICHDLAGQQLASADEAWPLRGLPDGKITLGFSDPIGDAEALLAGLRNVYPDLPDADVIVAPGGRFAYYGIHLDGPQALGERGLWGEYVSPGGETLLSRVDRVNDLSWDAVDSPALPFTATWRGVIYVPETGARGLIPVASDAVTVTIDGVETYPGPPLADTALPIMLDLTEGWHAIEVQVPNKVSPGGTLELSWFLPDGTRQPVADEDVFPLRELRGWIHERSLGQIDDRAMMRTQRVDFQPHESLPIVIEQALAPDLIARELFLTEERWASTWEIAVAGGYQFRASYQNGTVTLLIDGQPVEGITTQQTSRAQTDWFATLSAGAHRIELVQQFERRTAIAGLTLDLVGAPQNSAASLSGVRPVR